MRPATSVTVTDHAANDVINVTPANKQPLTPLVIKLHANFT
ncbi:hypothetical protein [Arsenophonus endosymbiont of Bemisia tabaci]|nr:hypothetical protein [Arsenophonus endosymbiont of Bemisia tabaci]